jgi:uncharacterized membrane-anchored protein
MWKNKKSLIAFALPIVILAGMTVSPLITLNTGDEVHLATKPIDPRDLLRGDYVILSYEAEEIHESKVDKEIKAYFSEKEAGSHPTEPLEVYSILEENNKGLHEVKEVVKKEPDSGLYLKGEIDYIWFSTDAEIRKYIKTEAGFKKEKANQKVHISYNLDKFFVPENTGKRLEDAIQSDSEEVNVFAVVKVRNGHAIVEDVKINQ